MSNNWEESEIFTLSCHMNFNLVYSVRSSIFFLFLSVYCESQLGFPSFIKIMSLYTNMHFEYSSRTMQLV